jgi:16S rRNA processing protein RimM
MSEPQLPVPDAGEQQAAAPKPEWVTLGAVNAVFGTRGWLKLTSDTRPRDAIFDYPVWHVGLKGDWQVLQLTECRVQGNTLLAKLRGVEDMESAEGLVGKRIAVAANELKPPPPGSYYWRDVIGMDVVTTADVPLGVVHGLAETGSNDVLRVRGDRERLIPFVVGLYVTDVDPKARKITVDWHPDD